MRQKLEKYQLCEYTAPMAAIQVRVEKALGCLYETFVF